MAKVEKEVSRPKGSYRPGQASAFLKALQKPDVNREGDLVSGGSTRASDTEPSMLKPDVSETVQLEAEPTARSSVKPFCGCIYMDAR